ncbi:endonuclease/exonuclease/phosphatase family protein [Streptomyces sp. NPDC002680]|uniref:endonuclease/exonuclease/phosphatase family protein n=1 Tax=Streptomyces sp. NPDC002680 TaxID=3364659 RepID=UPI0036A607B1
MGAGFGAVSVVVACRAVDADAVTPVPQLLAFLPWLLAPTAAGLLLALFARWRAGMVWGAVLLAVTGWFTQPYGTGSEPGGAVVAEVRVLTANVEFGEGTGALIPVVRRERPDLVFVEECEYRCENALATAFDGVYPYRETVPGAGSDGSVILSRFPLEGTEGIPGSTMGMPGAVAELAGGHSVRVQLAHPMPPVPGQVGLWRKELGALRDFAAENPSRTPTILAGDFNASQDHAAFRRLLDTGLRDAARLAGAARTPSWPARTAPTAGAQIDHVLVSGEFSASGARFLGIADSDHRALVVDLALHQRERAR